MTAIDPTRRRVVLAAGALCALPAPARGQRDARVGFVSPTGPGPRDEALVQGLAAHARVEGRGLVLMRRHAHGDEARLRPLVDELLAADADVLVVGATIGARAAKAATSTRPIVFAGSSDPVAAGLVASLARPGGNLTGTSLAYGDGLAGKWLEILTEVVPALAHGAALWSSANAAAARFVDELRGAAQRLAVALDVHHASRPEELDAALAAIGTSRAQALVVLPSPFAASRADALVRFAHERRLPAVYFSADFVDAGGLVSYGPSIAEAYRRAAGYVDRILKGARPGELPVEQPTLVELVVNARTARSLGLVLPGTLGGRADRIVG